MKSRASSSVLGCLTLFSVSLLMLLCGAQDAVRAQSPAESPQAPLAQATMMHQQVFELFQQGKYAEALGLAERALEIREKALGPDNIVVASSLNQLAALYLAMGDYARVEPLVLRAMKIREDFLGPNNLLFAKSLNSVAVLYQRIGNVRQAEELLERALAIVEKAKGADNADFALALSNLAAIYQDEGKYEQAEEKYVQALELRRKVFGEEHQDVALSLNNLASLYLAKGDYVRAEPLLRQALALREKSLGSAHPDVAVSLSNLASLYQDKGDYVSAEPLLLRALSIVEAIHGKEHPEVAAMLNNVAGLEMDKGNLAGAEKYLRRALAIREKILGALHPDTAASLNGLASFYRAKGDYAQAREMFNRALVIYRNVFGPEHPDVALCLNNLGVLAQDENDYAQAQELLLQALAIREKALGAEHPDVASSLSNLSTLSESKGEIAQAVSYLVRSNEIREHNLALVLTTGSENQKRLYLATLASETNSTISLHLKRASGNREAARLALTTILRRKGRALDAITDQIGALRRRFNRQDRDLLDRLSMVRTRLAMRVLDGPGGINPQKHRAQLEQLTAEVEELEAQVSARSAMFRAQAQPVTLERVQQSIPSGAALIEFVLYQPFDSKAKDLNARFGPERYAAYVLWREGDPAFVDLGEAASINQSVAKLGAALADPDSANVKQAARMLDQQVMAPVRRLLKNSHELLLSPDGTLNLIPFAALVDETGRYLVESYSINYLTSGRDLLKIGPQAQNEQSRQPPLVFANPAYGFSVKKNGASALSAESTAGRRSGALSQVNWPPLIGTAQEAAALRNILNDAQVFTGEQANEAALKRIAGPRLLHIATHGFFLPDESQKKTGVGPSVVTDSIPARANKSENPLLRSGLILAGANSQQSGPGEDGVLTALEAAGLDLWSTELVVLSACETGVGEIRNGEGVYGLRRALVLAGAESELMSLWQVSDRETRELMVEYYKRLQKGEGRTAALRHVQLRMLRRQPTAHPYYWASFIPVGDWRSLKGVGLPQPANRRVKTRATPKN
ncbi:MAG TPA: CHAT domain-containing tetratricopeptide repeat protein [Pyrinomonadaceae bacterium]